MEELSSLSSFSSSDVQAADDDDDLARHVWQHYTTSGTDLTKARERLESLSATRPPVTSATVTKVETSKVDVPEEKKSKVLQMKQKPPLDLTGTLSKNSEFAGSALTNMFGSKVNSVLVLLLLIVSFLLYLVLLIMTVKAASCADRLEQLREIAEQQREEWLERIKPTFL